MATYRTFPLYEKPIPMVELPSLQTVKYNVGGPAHAAAETRTCCKIVFVRNSGLFCKFFFLIFWERSTDLSVPYIFKRKLSRGYRQDWGHWTHKLCSGGGNLNIRHFATPLAFAPFTPYHNTSKMSSRHQHILSVLGCFAGYIP